MSALVASSEGSIMRSLASWFTQEVTRPTAGRRRSAWSERAGRAGGGRQFEASPSATALTMAGPSLPRATPSPTPRTAARSSVVRGAARAMETTAMSDRTWRTGWLTLAARSSRHIATDRTTGRSRRLRCRTSLSLVQASSGRWARRLRSRSRANSASAQSTRPSSSSRAAILSWISSRCITSLAAYSSCEVLSGRTSQSLSRSAFGGLQPISLS